MSYKVPRTNKKSMQKGSTTIRQNSDNKDKESSESRITAKTTTRLQFPQTKQNHHEIEDKTTLTITTKESNGRSSRTKRKNSTKAKEKNGALKEKVVKHNKRSRLAIDCANNLLNNGKLNWMTSEFYLVD